MTVAGVVRFVVVGTSWGGLLALRDAASAALPATFRLPLVVVQHRHKESDHLLRALLQDHTRAERVRGRGQDAARGGQRLRRARRLSPAVEPGHFALTHGGAGALQPAVDRRDLRVGGRRATGERTVGVVLTGANADGARGLRRIADRGGLALVQDPGTAESPTMPAAAIEACRARDVADRSWRSARSIAIAVDAARRSRRRGGADAGEAPAAPVGATRRRHPPRRRPPREPARARGDPRAARPDPRARALRRRGAAHAARARLRGHPARRADAGDQRLRDGAADQVARTHASYIPIIFLTAISKDEEYVFEGYSVGAVDYIVQAVPAGRSSARRSAVFVELLPASSGNSREQEQLLRESERRELELRAHARAAPNPRRASREIVGTAMDAIVVFDADGNASRCSTRAAERMFGTHGERRGRTIVAALPESVPEDVLTQSARPWPRRARADERRRRHILSFSRRRRAGHGEAFPIEASVIVPRRARQARRTRSSCATSPTHVAREDALKRAGGVARANRRGAQAAQRRAAPTGRRSSSAR